MVEIVLRRTEGCLCHRQTSEMMWIESYSSLLMKYHIGLLSAERHLKQLEKRAKLERYLTRKGGIGRGKTGGDLCKNVFILPALVK